MAERIYRRSDNCSITRQEPMKPARIEIKDKIDQLLAVLDKDIKHAERSLIYLNDLRSFVIKRDSVALARLLEKIRAQTDNYVANELKRLSLRRELADAFDCEPQKMNLSKLEANAPEQDKAQISRRKAKLTRLTKKLRQEHIATAMLLAECGRLNRLLVKTIFGTNTNSTVTYDSNGTTARQADTAFVNLQF